MFKSQYSIPFYFQTSYYPVLLVCISVKWNSITICIISLYSTSHRVKCVYTPIVFLHVAECFYKRRKLNVQIHLSLSTRLCPFRFNFLTVKGIYAELQPRHDRYFSTERTCSVYFKYTRFFIPSVRKCQLKSGCFTKGLVRN